MSQKIYALSVSINEYAGKVRHLEACLNDGERFYHNYLKKRFKDNLYYEELKNDQATRANVIELFDKHLGKATADDIVLFRFSGHGAQNPAAPEFKQYFPDGKDEGLVLYDSRTEGNWDLADKEFAVLLSRVAEKNPHIVIILDSCHSGSATRDVDEFNQLVPRFTSGRKEPRPLESYLDGHYTKMLAQDSSNDPEVIIPRSEHVLLAACDRKETAKEDPSIPHGIFTETLLEILEQDVQKGTTISYRDLFLRCRSEVRKRAQKQSPQFDAYGNFNANAGFLGGAASTSDRYLLEYKRKMTTDKGKEFIWRLERGAVAGLPTDRSKSTKLALYEEGEGKKAVGTGRTIKVGPKDSEVKLDFDGDLSKKYWAEITDLPIPPMPIFVDGEAGGKAAVEKAFDKDRSVMATATDNPKGTKYTIAAEDGNLYLKETESGSLIQWVKGNNDRAAGALMNTVKAVLNWERSLSLQNETPQVKPDHVEASLTITKPDGGTHKFDGEDINLVYEKIDGKWYKIPGKLKVKNTFRQTLHVALFYFSSRYGIYFLGYNNPIDSGDEATVWGENANDYFKLGKGVVEDTDIFKLVVSTEKVDDFMLLQDDLDIGGTVKGDRAIGSVGDDDDDDEDEITGDWFTKTIRVKTMRQLDKITERDTSLANQQIQIKGHPSLKANLTLSAASTNTRSASDGAGMQQFLQQNGLNMMSFAAATRDADEAVESQNILELNDLPDDLTEVNKTLEENPLEIELSSHLKDDEYILPLVFDGEHILMGGETHKDEEGKTQIKIHHIPEIDDHSRSLGKALKMYFFKTYLKRDNVNELCWVEFKEDGSIKRRKGNVANKVAEAKNILLLIHGIIGDTEGMAISMQHIKDENGIALKDKFDVILTYDYENLSTPISDTAAKLKEQLGAAGIGENDDKRLSLLVHSMGGLVSRWFVEQLGGNRMVDHLVMCGTPNNGSPFGQVQFARKALNALTIIGLNTVPALAPALAVVGTLLNRSKKITPTLEQMNPKSDFIKSLNNSGDPGIPYTILAGDIEAIDTDTDDATLIEKVGGGMLFSTLFSNQTHDIAASVDSVLGVGQSRQTMPAKTNVACHHLNYFSSPEGMKALQAVKW